MADATTLPTRAEHETAARYHWSIGRAERAHEYLVALLRAGLVRTGGEREASRLAVVLAAALDAELVAEWPS